jgi:hypothetical protein
MKNISVFTILATSLFLWASCGEDATPDPCQMPPQITNVARSPADCGKSSGAMQVTASGGNGTLSYSLNGAPFQAGSQFSQLKAGIYLLRVQDEQNCTAQQEVVIEEQNDMQLSVSVSTNAGCGTSTGSVALVASGGNGNFTFSLDGTNFQADPDFAGLAAGEYSAHVKDSEGCATNTSFTLTTGTSFENNIKAILETNCAIAGCHVAGTGRPNFTQFAEVKSWAATIKTRTSDKSMPPAGSGKSLTADEIAAIACWVDDGALQN